MKTLTYQIKYAFYRLVCQVNNSQIFFSRVRPRDECTISLFAGFYVEKGLGQVVRNMPYVKKNHIMQNDWYWHRFLRHAEKGGFDDTIKRLQEHSQCPVHIRMEAYPFNKVPERDTDRLPSEDLIEFLTPTTDIEFEIFKPAEEILSQFKECSHLRALAEKLSSFADIQYFWIDLHLGVYLQYGTKETGK